jgi:hypothetical protein
MELLVILAYAGILALVVPFVLPKTDFYGRLVPFSVALTSGSLVWLVLTWLGFSYTEAWIWLIAMLVMPVVTWLAAKTLLKNREGAEAAKLAQLRLSGKA